MSSPSPQRYQDVIVAGFGGQGVMFIGNLLAQAAMHQGLNVTFIPVYGPEMRGGTANCTVVISDAEIGSPLIKHPGSLIIMNRPSLEKFQPRLQAKGTLVLNSSLVDPELAQPLAEKSASRLLTVPVNDIADKLGDTRMANMVALGAYLQATGLVALESAEKALKAQTAEKMQAALPKNLAALQAGAAVVG